MVESGDCEARRTLKRITFDNITKSKIHIFKQIAETVASIENQRRKRSPAKIVA